MTHKNNVTHYQAIICLHQCQNTAMRRTRGPSITKIPLSCAEYFSGIIQLLNDDKTQINLQALDLRSTPCKQFWQLKFRLGSPFSLN